MVATKISELGAAPAVGRDSVIVVNAGGVTYRCTAKELLDVLGTAGFFFADPPQVRSNLGLPATDFAQTLLSKASAATAREHLDASQTPLDEDDFASNSATRPPSQQSVKAYVDATPSLGVDQSWTDMTASRAVNTTYTNSTGRTIQVSVTQVLNDGGLIGYVGGLPIARTGAPNTSATGNDRNFVTMTVPSGATYRVEPESSTGTIGWYELR